MIVYPDGSIEGTVGGGALEKRVIEQAREVSETGESRLTPIELREPAQRRRGMRGDAGLRGEDRDSTRLLILGGEHWAKPSRAWPPSCRCRSWYDDREEYAQPERFPPM